MGVIAGTLFSILIILAGLTFAASELNILRELVKFGGGGLLVGALGGLASELSNGQSRRAAEPPGPEQSWRDDRSASIVAGTVFASAGGLIAASTSGDHRVSTFLVLFGAVTFGVAFGLNYSAWWPVVRAWQRFRRVNRVPRGSFAGIP